jgi:23S rRNA maturation mini-RNase III
MLPAEVGMAQRADKLKNLLSKTSKVAAQAQAAFLKAEDLLPSLEEREQRRVSREDQHRDKVAERLPAMKRGH